MNYRLSNKLKKYFINKLKLLYLSDFEVIIVTEEDTVYEFARNLEILITLYENESSIIESKILNSLCCKKLVDFKSSHLHKIACTID
jgi:hypothetical protein